MKTGVFGPYGFLCGEGDPLCRFTTQRGRVPLDIKVYEGLLESLRGSDRILVTENAYAFFVTSGIWRKIRANPLDSRWFHAGWSVEAMALNAASELGIPFDVLVPRYGTSPGDKDRVDKTQENWDQVQPDYAELDTRFIAQVDRMVIYQLGKGSHSGSAVAQKCAKAGIPVESCSLVTELGVWIPQKVDPVAHTCPKVRVVVELVRDHWGCCLVIQDGTKARVYQQVASATKEHNRLMVALSLWRLAVVKMPSGPVQLVCEPVLLDFLKKQREVQSRTLSYVTDDMEDLKPRARKAPQFVATRWIERFNTEPHEQVLAAWNLWKKMGFSLGGDLMEQVRKAEAR